MPRLRLTAVMPNYNHARYLPEAIEGILGQSRPPDEFLILDDASTDPSVKIIEEYAARFPVIRFVRNLTNQGVLAAHERLFQMATGDWLYSGAADDLRDPEFFRLAMEMAEQNPSAGLVFGKMGTINAQGEDLGEIAPRNWKDPLFADPRRFLTEYLDVEGPFQAATVATIFRRDAFEEVGWFPPELGSFSDTFAVRAIGLKWGVGYVPTRLATWRKMPGSVSQSIRQNAVRSLEIVDQAAARMRSESMRDRFPADYVDRWERAARRQVLWNYLLGEDYTAAHQRPSRVWRNVARLRRLPGLIALACRTSPAPRN